MGTQRFYVALPSMPILIAATLKPHSSVLGDEAGKLHVIDQLRVLYLEYKKDHGHFPRNVNLGFGVEAALIKGLLDNNAIAHPAYYDIPGTKEQYVLGARMNRVLRDEANALEIL